MVIGINTAPISSYVMPNKVFVYKLNIPRVLLPVAVLIRLLLAYHSGAWLIFSTDYG